MLSHIVPQVYLKSWKKPGQPLFVFSKEYTAGIGSPKSLKMKETRFSESNKYNISTDAFNSTKAYRDEYLLLFEHVKNFSLTCNGNRIHTFDAFLDNYLYFSQWVIVDNAGKQLSNKKIKRELDDIWRSKQEKVIEEYFSHVVEQEWNNVLGEIQYIGAQHSALATANQLHSLIEFMAIQISRVFKPMIDEAVKPLLDSYFDTVLKPGLPEDYQGLVYDALATSEFYDENCKQQLYYYVKYKTENRREYSNNVVSHIISWLYRMKPILLFSNNETKYITSDCPCYSTIMEKTCPEEYKGIYLPITPDACVFFADCSQKEKVYYCSNISDQNVAYINQLTKNKCIENVAFSENAIASIISETPDIKAWQEMLKPIQGNDQIARF